MGIFLVISLSCKKLVEIAPPRTSLTAEAVFSNDESAIAAVNQVYANASGSDLLQASFLGLSSFPGLSSDELMVYLPNTYTAMAEFNRNALTALTATSNANQFWNRFYSTEVYYSNRIIEGLSEQKTSGEDSNSKLSGKVKKQLLGEMKFIRAFSYFYLVQLYGDVPLLTSSNYAVNSVATRTSKEIVYQQIISDLKYAVDNLSDAYLQSDLTTSVATSPRIRPIKWAAKALLARVYIFTGNTAAAETESKEVINNTNLYSLTTLENVFKANSREAIWQLQPVVTGRNTQEAWAFIATGAELINGTKVYYLNNALVSAFESGDLRRNSWIGSTIANGVTCYYPFKYKSATLNSPVTEYSMVLRVAEQYLICAEACVKNNKISEGQGFLNAIRNRAGLGNTTASTKDELLDAILAERRIELFSEFGHRWFDLKRTGKIDDIMRVATPNKGGLDWQP